MIRLLEEDRIGDFHALCRDSIIGATLSTRLRAYSLDGGALFWYGEENGEMLGAGSLFDGVFTYFCKRGSTEEFEAFAAALGACTARLDGKIILKYDKSSACAVGDGVCGDFKLKTAGGEEASLLMPLIFGSGDFDREYTDISHKLRHGLIHARYVEHCGRAVSCALTSGETDALCVISAVSTLEEYRRRGFARLCVTSLADSLKADAFVVADGEKIARYYEKIGFIRTGGPQPAAT